LLLYYDGPAIRADLGSTILDINGVKVSSLEGLSGELHKYASGEKINVTVLGPDNSPLTREITLGNSPENKNLSWLGVGFSQSPQNQGLMSWFYSFFSLNRNHIYYASQIGDIGIFIYNLLWWLVIINVSVALINMLPMGIFDGGRFFYVTVWGITKNEKIAKIAFKVATYFFLLVLAVVMFFWLFYIR
jgi:membrane-associated protease RseP (regulator of RpoE activity)